ncbi:hypothetical protein GALMADRAFT_213347 [Galerina marginata CBS 339.88]|uniref:Alpha-type protein kinase domain-containing protein n=1 Tax=Galerina marginata (strain CBS 339.88) TaxID=685588 RepID=A0A067SXC1_GALM3|nr:hypothetical protein GALMADRAFT_213347 [Galerina marginata CBS 339.88]
MVCSGCSRFKKLPEGRRCDPCTRLAAASAPKALEEWPLCNSCGTAYEFLYGTVCSICSEPDDHSMPPPSLPGQTVADTSRSTVHLDAAREAMNNPVDPRTYSAPSSSQRVPSNQNAAAVHSDNNTARSNHASAVLGGFITGYGSTYARVQAKANASGLKIPQPKLSAAALQAGPIKKPSQLINVGITRIVNRFNEKLTTHFNTQVISYPESTLWSDVARDLMFWLDGIYTMQFKYRIQSEADFTLVFTPSKGTLNSVNDFDPDSTLGNFWIACTQTPGLHVIPKNIKVHRLELTAHVNYPQQDGNSVGPYDDEGFATSAFSTHTTRSTTSKKRRTVEDDTGSDDESHRPKRQAITKKGGHLYHTNITGSVSFSSAAVKFVVRKVVVSLSSDSDTAPKWSKSDEKLSVWVAKEKFASGKTKNAFKMQLGGSYYAAKSFYDLGDHLGTPSHYRNLKHLKEELLRQKTIEQALSRFNREAKDQRISVFEMEVADSFILEVVDGPQAGLAWIVDPFLDSKNMRKLSGTDMAGIVHPIARRNIIGTDCLTLFDLMGHSIDGTMGLGDKGLTGIQDFCNQHQCNRICKKFDLEKTTKLALRLPLDDDDSDTDKYIGGENASDDPSSFDRDDAERDFNDANAENEVTSADAESGSGKDISPEAESEK